ncbi:MAG: BMP family ABC transporter substrate-binding protein, partial [Treponema sp.]|nr:BMP family ABC transporter substrate-binding protein [Treponema sp.]
MKKSVLALIIGIAFFALAGCGKQSGAAAPDPGRAAAKPNKDNIKVGFVYIGSINDEGYTQAHDKGRLAVEALGVSCAYIENVPENADCEKALRDLIDQGCNVIYTNSFGFMNWTLK